MSRNILITCALPYANGDIHLGHLVEFIQADIWARFQRMQGNTCYFICGSDAHGTPVMLSAKKLNLSPEALVTQVREKQLRDLTAFNISLDNFYTTHSNENKRLSEAVFNALNANGDIEKRTIDQAFDEEKQIFLPDRFVKGQCPKCDTPDQYGDSCDHCGATYSPLDMENPISTISNTTPIIKSSEHYFFKLTHYENRLKDWLDSAPLQREIKHKLQEWFDEGLSDWDISRDTPYFGFTIPGETEKYFYVWLDAPIGYMASFEHFCQSSPDVQFDDVWQSESKAELYHFIGKDIMYFHALFWPAILLGANYRLPTNIFVHGFLTVDGKKMSKSRGTFIKASEYLTHADPNHLRYYVSAKLNEGVADIDLNFTDFKQRVNADLVGKVVNIASRCAGFIHKKSDGLLADTLADPDLFNTFAKANTDIAHHIESRNYAKAVRQIMQLADLANRYIDDKKPWIVAKEKGSEKTVQLICTQGLNLFRLLVIYLKPILPTMADDVETFLQIEPLSWQDYQTPLLNHQIASFKPLMQRISDETIAQFDHE